VRDDRRLEPRPGNVLSTTRRSTSVRSPHGRQERAARFAPLFVALVTFIAFAPTLGNGFVNWDDEKNFLNNPHYRGLGLSQLGWMWTTFHLGHYVPLSWMTLGFDYSVWGMNPAGYHLTNLLLHTADAVILYFVARRILRLTSMELADPLTVTLSAAFGALLFAVHPLRVESVAWVTERRDVLSLFFYLLSILAYLRATDGGRRRWYWGSVALCLCAILSKATAMTLPAVLAILNAYPLKRLGGDAGWFSDRARRVYLELLPFALMSAGTVVLSLVALHPPSQLGFGDKIAVSAYSLSFYVWKTLVPLRLAPLYEMPRSIDPIAAEYVVSYGVVIAVAGIAWSVRRRWPGVTAGLAAFVVMILPMLGAVQNGPQIAADRYTYYGGCAAAILIAGGVFSVGRSHRALASGIGVGLIVVLAGLTWVQTNVWHDSEALWTQVLAVDDESSIGHSAMANLLYARNDIDAAMSQSRRSIALAPNFAEAHNDLGVGLARQRRFAEAIGEYQRALALKSPYDEAENNLGVVAAAQGDLDKALEWYQDALTTNPDNPDAQVNWGNVLVRLGKPSDAIAHYREALRIRPDHADAHHNWGVALAQQGKYAEAIEQFQQALAINPQHVEARDYLERATRALRQPPTQ
jgi:tetratricopeptide (TPR) repeat protein